MVHPSGAVQERKKNEASKGKEDSFNPLIAFATLFHLHSWQKFWQRMPGAPRSPSLPRNINWMLSNDFHLAIFLALFVVACCVFWLLAPSDCYSTSKRRRGNSKLSKWDLLSRALLRENLLKQKRKVVGEAGGNEDQDTNHLLFKSSLEISNCFP